MRTRNERRERRREAACMAGVVVLLTLIFVCGMAVMGAFSAVAWG